MKTEEMPFLVFLSLYQKRLAALSEPMSIADGAWKEVRKKVDLTART